MQSSLSRRSFLAFAAVCPIAAINPIGDIPAKYGLLTIERYQILKHKGITLRVVVDGEDVTNRCREADDVTGFAECFKRNSKGDFYEDLNTGEVAREFLRGRVEFIKE